MSQEPPTESAALVEKPRAEVAAIIADRLGETDEGARKQIKQIVLVLGRTQVCQLLEKTIQIEEQGGMMLPNGSRRRTPGGVFFHLAYTTGITKAGKKLIRPQDPTKKRVQTKKPEQPATPAAPIPTVAPFTWEDRIAAIEAIGEEKGWATTVKITLIGQFGKYVDKGSCVMGVMQHTGEKFPALPKGVPVPQATKTSFVVYIGVKQWKNVAAAATDSEDVLIIEGFPQIDEKTGAISVFASNVTSKKLQAAKRQQE